MAAHQCPRCELKFSFRTEVAHHLSVDHHPAPPPDAAADRTATTETAAPTADQTGTGPEPVPRQAG